MIAEFKERKKQQDVEHEAATEAKRIEKQAAEDKAAAEKAAQAAAARVAPQVNGAIAPTNAGAQSVESSEPLQFEFERACLRKKQYFMKGFDAT